jgi:translation initiation factor 5
MALVNIPRSVKDEFYRYKMPALVAKVEGRGNGIKTLCVNMADIAKALDRPPAYTTKYFGFELGALTTIDPQKDRFIVNGKHDQSKLASVLDNFIKDFVLCHNCKNPETKMLIRGDNIELKCAACGARSPVNMRHKLTTFILKNPPSDAGGVDEPRKDKKKTKATKQRKAKKSSDEEEEPEEDLEEEEQEEKPKPKTPKKKKASSDEEDGVVWYTDTSKEAAEQRRRQMLDDTSELAAKLVVADSAQGDNVDPIEKLKKLVSSGTPNDEKIISEVQKTKEEQKWDDEHTAKATFELLFTKDILKQLKPPKTNVLKKIVGTSAKGQQGVLAALVELCGVKETGLLKSVPHILKALYDLDIVDEDVIIGWYDNKQNGAASKVKDAAKVFVDWLKNASEESEEEDE